MILTKESINRLRTNAGGFTYATYHGLTGTTDGKMTHGWTVLLRGKWIPDDLYKRLLLNRNVGKHQLIGGIRNKELSRLEWRDITINGPQDAISGVINIEAYKAKTRQRRPVTKQLDDRC